MGLRGTAVVATVDPMQILGCKNGATKVRGWEHTLLNFASACPKCLNLSMAPITLLQDQKSRTKKKKVALLPY